MHLLAWWLGAGAKREGPKGGFIYALDITPIMRSLPTEAQAGLLQDEGAAWDGIPTYEWYNDTHRPPHTREATPAEAHILGEGGKSLCNIDAPLRYHRLAAAGKHVVWSNEGLDIVASPPNAVGSVVIDDVDSVLGETIEHGVLLSDDSVINMSQPFLGPVNTEWHYKSGLRYPLITTGDLRFTDSFALTSFHPVGRAQKTGHFGAASALLFGGMTQSFLSKAYVHLEVWGTVRKEVLAAAAPGDGSQWAADAANLSVPISMSRQLDDSIVYWGLWAEPSDPAEPAPPSRYNHASVSIPMCAVTRHADPFKAFPMHPLAELRQGLQEEWAAACQKETGDFPLPSPPPGLPPTATANSEFHYQGLGASIALPHPSRLSEPMSVALDGYLEVLREGRFGSRSAGWEACFITPAGFPRWPGVTARLLLERIRDVAPENLLMLKGGCRSESRSLQESALCL